MTGQQDVVPFGLDNTRKGKVTWRTYFEMLIMAFLLISPLKFQKRMNEWMNDTLVKVFIFGFKLKSVKIINLFH